MENPDDERSLEQNQKTPARATAQRGSWLRSKWTWLILLGVASVVLAMAWVMKRSGPSPETRGGRDVRRASDHSPGSEVILFLEGRTSVMVAADEKALDDLITAVSTRGEKVETMIQEGRVLVVPNNTRARVVEMKFATLKVRIIEGEKMMYEVWVLERWVR